jgi:protein-arginine kinase activator protein McsA
MSLLSISEKREWLAKIFRDKTGEYTDADKFKAMEADNRLTMLQYTEDRYKDVTEQDTGRKCSNCSFYFKDSSDIISPGCDACALGQNPTAVPCGHYSRAGY